MRHCVLAVLVVAASTRYMCVHTRKGMNNKTWQHWKKEEYNTISALYRAETTLRVVQVVGIELIKLTAALLWCLEIALARKTTRKKEARNTNDSTDTKLVRPTVHGALHTHQEQHKMLQHLKWKQENVTFNLGRKVLGDPSFYLFMTLVLIGVSLIVWGSSCGVIVCVGLDEGTNAFNNWDKRSRSGSSLLNCKSLAIV
jgi:hypothetical protein